MSINITKIDNSNELKINLNSGSTIYMLNGDFHRGNGLPAIITLYSEEYFYRGVKITKEISKGKLSTKEILELKNMEERQRAMEILGYGEFLKIFTKIHEFTPPQFLNKFLPDQMYTLYELKEKDAKEPIKILRMYDPSKIPFEKYFIRVKPDEIDCGIAVAHSYHLNSWEEFIFCKNWV